MLKKTWNYVSLLIIIAAAAAELEVDLMESIGGIDYDDIEIEERTMPSDFAIEIKNKTDFELAMEECMVDFVNCKSMGFDTIHSQPVCAELGEDGTERETFENFCFMVYESCKEFSKEGEGWHFLNDGPCGPQIPKKSSKDSREPTNTIETVPEIPIPVQASTEKESLEDRPMAPIFST